MSYAYHIPHIGSPEVLTRKNHIQPLVGAGQVLIRNHATAVNFIDTIIRRGDMPDGMMPDLPHIPGVEGAGIVEAIGAGVTHVAIGDRVAWLGPIGAEGYSSYSVIDAPYVTLLADNIDYIRAASLPVNATTAWHMLVNLGRVEKGQKILVHAAAGGVGTMILHIAKHLELEVIASVSTDKIDYAKQQGADHVIDYRQENVTERIMALTNGHGVDLTLNPIAGNTLKSDMDALAPMGTALIFGFLAGPPQGSFDTDLTQHFNKSIAVRVSDLYTYYFNRPQQVQQDLAKIFDLLAQNILRPQIQTLPLDKAAEAHRRLEGGEVQGKLVLEITA